MHANLVSQKLIFVNRHSYLGNTLWRSWSVAAETSIFDVCTMGTNEFVITSTASLVEQANRQRNVGVRPIYLTGGNDKPSFSKM